LEDSFLMYETLVSDELWEIIEPLLPPDPPKEKGGRPRIPNRNVFAGIVYVLKSGVPWRMLPKEIGGGSGTTCWRRLRDWQKSGVWWRVHRILLDHLGRANLIDWSRASLDSASIPAKRGREDRSQPPGSRSPRFEASPCHRREWCAADGSTHQRKPTRLEGSRRVDRLD
jgi:transposase